ncbi:MAG: hypothetical protein KJ042_06210 [Deltaproteobacteria bacterium]|nr:hypothetical protein [Deltaproteobacteria bacterium]
MSIWLKRWALVAALTAIVAFAGACGGDDDDDDSSDTPTDDDSDDDDDTDDDTGDDDVADDDTTDDDTGDDDTTDDDTGDDDTGDDDAEPLPIAIDFDDYAPGDLPEPWVTAAQGASNGQVVALVAADGSGLALQVTGDTDSGDFFYAGYAWEDTDEDISFSFDFWREDGASGAFAIVQPNLQKKFLAGVAPAGQLAANDANSVIDCGETLAANTWYTITFVLTGGAAGTYTVQLDGVDTACVDHDYFPAATDVFHGLLIGDGDTAGLGGEAWFDNIVVDLI